MQVPLITAFLVTIILNRGFTDTCLKDGELYHANSFISPLNINNMTEAVEKYIKKLYQLEKKAICQFVDLSMRRLKKE